MIPVPLVANPLLIDIGLASAVLGIIGGGLRIWSMMKAEERLRAAEREKLTRFQVQCEERLHSLGTRVDGHDAADRKMTADLGMIKTSLARIETSLEAMKTGGGR